MPEIALGKTHMAILFILFRRMPDAFTQLDVRDAVLECQWLGKMVRDLVNVVRATP